jgi:hypothetical protein
LHPCHPWSSEDFEHSVAAKRAAAIRNSKLYLLFRVFSCLPAVAGVSWAKDFSVEILRGESADLEDTKKSTKKAKILLTLLPAPD